MWWLSDDPGELERRFGIRTDPGLRLPPEFGYLWEALAKERRRPAGSVETLHAWPAMRREVCDNRSEAEPEAKPEIVSQTAIRNSRQIAEHSAFKLGEAIIDRRYIGTLALFGKQALSIGKALSNRPWLACDRGGDDGRVVVHVARAGSSRYDVLKDGLDRGRRLPRLLACVSGSGERFHGHRERSWAASAGNLHLSVLVRSEMHAGRTGLGLSMLPVVAVAEMLDGLLPEGVRPGIKWVNDIVIDGRKIGGVLASSRICGGLIEECLFGIGLNVAVAPEIEPTVFVPGTTCLAEWTEEPPILGGLVFDLILRIEKLVRELGKDGPGRLHEAYCGFADGIGRDVCVWLDEPGDPLTRKPLASGRLLAIRPDLSLEIEGTTGPVNRGRLAFGEDVERGL